MTKEKYAEKMKLRERIKNARRVRDRLRNLMYPQPPEPKYPPMRAANPKDDKEYWNKLGAKVVKKERD